MRGFRASQQPPITHKGESQMARSFLNVEGAVVTEVLDTVSVQDVTGKPSTSRQFTVYLPQDYNNNGQSYQKQFISHRCVTFDPAMIQMLDTIQPKDVVNFTAFEQAGTKVFIPTGQPGGLTFFVPDAGRKPVPVQFPDGQVVQIEPTARPYDLTKNPGWPVNAYMHDSTQLNVQTLTKGTDAGAIGQAAGAADTTVSSGEVASVFGAAQQEQTQQTQQNLNNHAAGNGQQANVPFNPHSTQQV